MRIQGPNGPSNAGGSSGPRRTTSGGFVLPDASPAPQSTASSAVRTIPGIEALLALQGVEDSTERRRRAVARGRSALDILENIKLSLLAGDLDPGLVGRLRDVAAGLAEPTGTPGLDAVLAEIELRVEVEIAKLTTGHA